jgi:hypothetical protein
MPDLRFLGTDGGRCRLWRFVGRRLGVYPARTSNGLGSACSSGDVGEAEAVGVAPG